MRGLWTLSNGGGITDLVLAVPKAELALVDAEIDDGGYTSEMILLRGCCYYRGIDVISPSTKATKSLRSFLRPS